MSGYELPKHLIITGMNGTGKTILLESISQALRRKYIEVTGNVISLSPNEAVSTELTYCETLPKYFEPLFVTVEHMFKPSKGLDNKDYLHLLVEISKNSKSLSSSLTNSLGILYGDDFESLDADNCQIKLKNHKPFKIDNMSSGHYSFLNVFCCVLFRKFALQWEDNDLWEFIYKELIECQKTSKNIVDKLSTYDTSHTSIYSRTIKNLLDDEKKRQNNINNALNVAQSRYEVISRTGSAERSRARDNDIALELSRAKQVSGYEAYLNNEKVDIWFEISPQKKSLNNKITACLNRLLNCKISNNENPMIILIDEPEIHLHVALQKRVLPYLEECFPNAQFIVATHSPFVITSLKSATLFNLENGETLSDDLTLYSYKNVIEEWFDIYSCSEEVKSKYSEFKKLANLDEKLSAEEIEEYINLYSDLIKTDLISSVLILNLKKQIKDGEIYVLR